MNPHGTLCLLLITLSPLSFSERHHIFPIGEYEALDYPTLEPPILSRSKRSLDQLPTSFSFTAFGQNFSLALFRDEGVISPTATISVGGQTFPLSTDDNQAYPVRGYIKSHPKSLVYGSVLNGIFRGTIAFNANSLGLFVESPLTILDVYFVEPAGNYLSNPTFHSVIYRANGTRQDEKLIRRRRGVEMGEITEPTFCGHSNPEISQRLKEMSQPFLGN
ncbi:unnamed protein product [Rodentolepis nana]|uniref:Pep_M12B_propep domain-containing protein n=1 Tax=Rodentolepis nana TaxID=102285 RepID=A0A0R3T975_RODNA|nr:unnamed protein product [Rodentolepis nana]